MTASPGPCPICGWPVGDRSGHIVAAHPEYAGERWYFAPGGTPFVVRDVYPPARCIVPVLPGGDGAGLAPLEERTERCTHLADRRVGAGAFTCSHHLAIAFQIAEIPPAELERWSEPPYGRAVDDCIPPRALALDL